MIFVEKPSDDVMNGGIPVKGNRKGEDVQYQNAVYAENPGEIAMSAIEQTAKIDCKIRNTRLLIVPGVPGKFVAISKT